MTNVEKSKRLREIRKALKLQQAAMADLLGVNRSYLSELENAHSAGEPPVQDYLIEKAEALLKGAPHFQHGDLSGQHATQQKTLQDTGPNYEPSFNPEAFETVELEEMMRKLHASLPKAEGDLRRKKLSAISAIALAIMRREESLESVAREAGIRAVRSVEHPTTIYPPIEKH